MPKSKTLIACAALALLGLTGTAKTATLVIDDSGALPALLGATGVEVGGALYDVDFVDGTCVAVFDGCDSNADFAFTTPTGALAAVQALLDQVLIDGVTPNLFDTDPELTRGCEAAGRCVVFTPFAIDPTQLTMAAADNKAPPSPPDEVYLIAAVGSLANLFDTAPNPNATWARFSRVAEVPGPETLTLLAASLVAFGWTRRRRYADLRS